MRHTDEFWRAVQQVRTMLPDGETPAAAATTPPRLRTVLDGVRAGLACPAMLRAGQVLFEDYTVVRTCVRLMLRMIRRVTAPHP